MGGRLFIPTRHFHGDVAARGRGARGGEEGEDHWDHTIVSVGAIEGGAGEEADARLAAGRGTEYGPGILNLRGFLAARACAPPFYVPGVLAASAVRRRTIRGRYPNDDLWWACDSQLTARPGGACTLGVTGPTHLLQPWWSCGTCAAAGGALAEPGAGVCAACAVRCHAGHALVFVARSPFFCDCGCCEARRGGAPGVAAAADAMMLAAPRGAGLGHKPTND